MINELKLGLVREQAESTLELCRDYERAWREVDRLKLEAAKYKAYFFHKEELVKKLEDQLRENFASQCGYPARYRSLERMLEVDIITASEYDFCNI